jgi:hypothetical protein
VPTPGTPKSFVERIRVNYPEADRLAFERIFTDGQSTLFDGKRHKPLYDKAVIVAALYLAEKYAEKIGYELRMTVEEKRIFKKRFIRALDLES